MQYAASLTALLVRWYANRPMHLDEVVGFARSRGFEAGAVLTLLLACAETERGSTELERQSGSCSGATRTTVFGPTSSRSLSSGVRR